MSDTWSLLDASETEAAAFPTLAAVIEAAGELAAPPNRWREVRIVDRAGHRYYLKVFHRTQTKNRLRNALTAPRCTLDADREAAVARALSSAGVPVARQVGVGRRGRTSYYLCAALEGESVASLRRDGRWRASDDRDLAEFCGSIAAAGIVLTDLSADHVFVTPDGFAVIDLHNGRQRRHPKRREWVRMLRRFARSVRGLDVSRRRALRFVARLLDRGGAGGQFRAIVERLPPFDTHGRYDTGQRSARYRDRNPERAAREVALLRRAWPGRPGDVVADVPCGAGRLAPFVARDRDATWIGGDRSAAMLHEVLAVDPNAWVVQCDTGRLPFPDHGVNGAVVFRLLHHLERGAAERTVREAARVAADWVLVSFFHPISGHNVSRSLRAIAGKARTRHTLWPHLIRRWMRAAGFEHAHFVAESPYRRDLWIGVFSRGAPRHR
ncbi:MAG: methyltransferase domain-containing protein [Planctomycetes bacterium]|nr:methyltransferase domain-containing protein [Planctomycetota bacterium]